MTTDQRKVKRHCDQSVTPGTSSAIPSSQPVHEPLDEELVPSPTDDQPSDPLGATRRSSTSNWPTSQKMTLIIDTHDLLHLRLDSSSESVRPLFLCFFINYRTFFFFVFSLAFLFSMLTVYPYKFPRLVIPFRIVSFLDITRLVVSYFSLVNSDWFQTVFDFLSCNKPYFANHRPLTCHRQS